MEECAYAGKADYGLRCLELLKEMEPEIKVHDEVSLLILPSVMKHSTEEGSLQLYVDMIRMGLLREQQDGFDSHSRCVMPFLDLDYPMVTLTTISKEIERALGRGKGVTWNQLCNTAISHLLRTEDKQNFYRALSCASRNSVVPYLRYLTLVLNNAYLAHDDDLLEGYVYMIATSLHQARDEDVAAMLENLHSSVPYKRPDRNADEVLREVLEALKRRHVGLAKEACGNLEAAVGGDAECKGPFINEVRRMYGILPLFSSN